MYVVLLYLQRNENLLDFAIGTWGIIGLICVNDQSYGQGINLPDLRGNWEFWSDKFFCLWNKFVVFDSNSVKMSVSFDKSL